MIDTCPQTSLVLLRLARQAPRDHVTPAWIVEALHERAFGCLMLLLGLLALLPSLSTIAAILMLFPAAQMVLAREKPALPRWIADRPLATSRFSRLVDRLVPVLQRMEVAAPGRRGHPSPVVQRVLGALFMVLGLSILAPVPLSNVPPAIAIMLLAVASLQRDGRLLSIALAAAVLSLAFSAGICWAAVAGIGALS